MTGDYLNHLPHSVSVLNDAEALYLFVQAADDLSCVVEWALHSVVADVAGAVNKVDDKLVSPRDAAELVSSVAAGSAVAVKLVVSL
jgi:hypothetical protein